jgi:hypothetical protein
MYGKTSMTNQGAHYYAREKMIKSSMDRNKSMNQIDSRSQNDGFIDLNRSKHSKLYYKVHGNVLNLAYLK